MIKLNKIGSDPEFGIISIGKQTLPSFLFFEGTKDKPEQMGNGFAILKDNLLVEGNIPACSTKEEFIDSIKFLKDLITIAIKKENSSILSTDIIKYEKMWLSTPDAQEFGCSDFKNAYKKGKISTPHMEGDTRQVGFHIHISFDILDKQFSRKKYARYIAKAMDYFIGLPSDEISYSEERRSSYGQLGAYRDVSYGLEYRALGGFFTQDKYLAWVYDQTVKTIEFCSVLDNLKKLDTIGGPDKSNYELLNINLENQIPLK